MTTLSTQRARSGREPITVVEVDLDYCSRSYGRMDNAETGTSGCAAANVQSGTASGGSGSGITIPTLSGSIDLSGTYIRLTGGTGSGQERLVQSHVQGSPNDTLVVTPNWTTAPTGSTTYSVHDADGVLLADRMCFNTLENCQDTTNYLPAAKTYRFCEARAKLPTDQGLYPCLVKKNGVDLSPTKIDPTQGIGRRASVTCKLMDFTHHDIGIDKSARNRSYDRISRGTFFGRLIQRNKFYQNRTMRIRSGYIVDPWDWTAFETRAYVIDSFAGPDANGAVTVVGKDVLKLADDKRALIPRPSDGTLNADITDTDSSFVITPTSAASDYPASNFRVRIGDELIDVGSRSGATCSSLTRHAGGTTADSHDAGDTIQKCYVLSDENVVDFVRTALTGADPETGDAYAGIDSSYINNTDWNAQRDTYLSSYDLERTLSEPVGVAKIITELIQIAPFYVWWDEREQEIKLLAVRPASDLGTLTLINDDASILKGSLKVKEDASARISEVWFHYLPINQLEVDETKHFRRIKVTADLAAFSANEYGERRVKKVYAPWYDATNAGQVVEMSNRLLNRYRDNQRMITFRLDPKDADLWTGDVFRLNTDYIQSSDGSQRDLVCRVMSVREQEDGYDYEVVEELLRSDRIFIFGPDSLGNYNVESDGNKAAYGFWADDNGLMSDLTAGYQTV